MNSPPANLRELMTRAGISENRLSLKTGVPQPTIHRILNNRVADPRDGTLRPLAEFFGVTVEEMRTNLPPAGSIKEPLAGSYRVKVSEDQGDIDPDREIDVPEMDVQVSAGNGNAIPEYIDTKGSYTYRLSWFASVGAKPEQVRVMAVSGDSMERTLFHGDRIAVNLADNRQIIDGRVYVFATGGISPDVKIKRLFKTTDGRLRVVSDNADKALYPDEILSAEDVENICIIGRVIDRSGRGGL